MTRCLPSTPMATRQPLRDLDLLRKSGVRIDDRILDKLGVSK
jgi:hypothetical protein